MTLNSEHPPPLLSACEGCHSQEAHSNVHETAGRGSQLAGLHFLAVPLTSYATQNGLLSPSGPWDTYL